MLVGLYAVHRLRNLLLLFVLAGGAAAALDPAVKYLMRRSSVPRWGIAALMLATALVLGAAAGWWGYVRIGPGAKRFLDNPPAAVHAFVVRSLNGEHASILGREIDAQHVSDWLLAQAHAKLGPTPETVFGRIAAAALFGVILFFVLFFYFLAQGPDLARASIKLAPPDSRPRLRRLFAKAGPVLQRYFAGLFVVVLFTSLATWFFVGPIFHLPAAPALGLITGVLELIPVAGPTASMTLLSAVAIMHGGSLWNLAGFGLFCFLLRMAIDQVIGPVVLGRSVKLSPVVVIFAFLAGGALLGVLGALIAIPTIALARMALEDYYALPGE